MIWWLVLTGFLWFTLGVIAGMMVARMVIVEQLRDQ
jgi:uncharacterized protein YneF (UPF0154 family)